MQYTIGYHQGLVSALGFSPDGRTLASGSYDHTVKLWDLATRELLRTLEGHTDIILSVTFLPDGGTLASESRGRVVKLWDPATGKLRHTLDHNPHSIPRELNPRLSIQDGQWVCLLGERVLWLPLEFRPTCFVADGSRLCVGHGSGRVSFMDFSI